MPFNVLLLVNEVQLLNNIHTSALDSKLLKQKHIAINKLDI